MTAAGLVFVGGTDVDDLAAPAEALGTVGGIAADHADGEVLGDELSDTHQEARHGKRDAAEILVEAGHDHPAALIGQLLADGDDLVVEELDLIDADDLGVRIDAAQDIPGLGHGDRRRL